MMSKQRAAVLAEAGAKNKVASLIKRMPELPAEVKRKVYQVLNVDPRHVAGDDPAEVEAAQEEARQKLVDQAIAVLSDERLKGSSAYTRAEMELKRLGVARNDG